MPEEDAKVRVAFAYQDGTEVEVLDAARDVDSVTLAQVSESPKPEKFRLVAADIDTGMLSIPVFPSLDATWRDHVASFIALVGGGLDPGPDLWAFAVVRAAAFGLDCPGFEPRAVVGVEDVVGQARLSIVPLRAAGKRSIMGKKIASSGRRACVFISR